MTVIVLPTSRLPASVTPKPLDYGGWQEPVNGGVITRLDRPGNRFSLDVTIPRLKPEPDGRIWVARLLAAIGNDAQIAFPQVGLTVGATGSLSLDAAAASMSSSISVHGFPAGFPIREGQFFNLIDSNGTRYLHQKMGADVAADGSGHSIFDTWPPLRFAAASGTVVNFSPVIQGRLSGNEAGWTIERAGLRGLQFTITERR